MKTSELRAGALSGVLAGSLVGAMMGSTDAMLLVAGKMAGLSTSMVYVSAMYPVAGLALHLGVSSVAGVMFAWLVGCAVRGPFGGGVRGVLFGVVLWVVGPLTLVPLVAGMDPLARFGAAFPHLAASLALHVVFGASVGAVFGWRKQIAPASAGMARKYS